MTIASTVDELMAHPYWDNEHDRRILLIDFAIHIYHQTCAEAAICYRANRRFTPTECFIAIRDMSPPTLALFLHKPECTIIQISQPAQNERADNLQEA